MPTDPEARALWILLLALITAWLIGQIVTAVLPQPVRRVRVDMEAS